MLQLRAFQLLTGSIGDPKGPGDVRLGKTTPVIRRGCMSPQATSLVNKSTKGLLRVCLKIGLARR